VRPTKIAMSRGAEAILENVVRFISQLDEDTLQTVQNLPVLEMAKAAFLGSIGFPLPQALPVSHCLFCWTEVGAQYAGIVQSLIAS